MEPGKFTFASFLSSSLWIVPHLKILLPELIWCFDIKWIPFRKANTGLKKSAAGLCIGMGSFSDPEELPGLAHFLEHMVFMGSEKFPSENGFDSFVNKNGGFDNAHTEWWVGL